MAFTIDVDENKWSKEVLETLLIDRTTNRNIIWGTDDYEALGREYDSHYPIKYQLITGRNSGVIQPRVMKSNKNKGERTKSKAEVFTPSWVCNAQNNLVDNAWFERINVFNKEDDRKWIVRKEKIVFPEGKDKIWQKYVDDRRLEITCGEAPYLVSRYDTVTGKPINVKDRIGILDRKMRIVNENVNEDNVWHKWTERAFQSVYGFEFQGDSLLIARENLLATYCDYYNNRFNAEPAYDKILNIAKIISWNLWQMDGLKFTIPYEVPKESHRQLTLYDNGNVGSPCYCVIMDWRSKKKVVFKTLLN